MSNIFSSNVRIGGVFTITKSTSSGILTDERQFNNLIVDNGLNAYGQNHSSSVDLFLAIYLSTSTTDPTTGDTAMGGTSISTTTSSGVYTTGVQTQATAGNGWVTTYRVAKRFAVGTATGTWSMIGVGSGTSGLFAKTRIKDGGGAPSSITVLATEQLDIAYDINYQWSTATGSGVINIAGTNYNYTTRCAGVGSLSSTWRPHNSVYANNAYSYICGASAGTPVSFRTTIGDGTDSLGNLELNYSTAPTGRIYQSYGPYVNNSFSRTITFSHTTADVVTGDKVSGFQVQAGGGPANKIVFVINDGTRATGVPKSNLDTLGITYAINWGRV